MDPRYWIEVDGKPKECSLLEWAEWFEKPGNRVVLQSTVGTNLVSTVFLGTNHRFLLGDEREPLLYETMIFDADHNDIRDVQWRYATRDEALAGHALAVQQEEERLEAEK